MATDPYGELGAFLTGYEAERLAEALEAGESTAVALEEIHSSRRTQAGQALADAGVGHQQREISIAVLRAVAGARRIKSTVTPVWTMPGSEATIGRLTSETRRLIDGARMSVVCSTYNFSPYSQMWTALSNASKRPGVAVTIYLDAKAGGADAVATQMPKATVFRTTTMTGAAGPLVSHAKFIVIDRALLLLTSANFSYNAEHSNIELGLLVHDTALAISIEGLMRKKHGTLYERVKR